MFKKKGGLAFKPKIPSARPRPAAPAAASQPSKPVETQAPANVQCQGPAQEVSLPSDSRRASIDVAGARDQNLGGLNHENILTPPRSHPEAVVEAETTELATVDRLRPKAGPSEEERTADAANTDQLVSAEARTNTNDVEHAPAVTHPTPTPLESAIPTENVHQGTSNVSHPEISASEGSVTTTTVSADPAPSVVDPVASVHTDEQPTTTLPHAVPKTRARRRPTKSIQDGVENEATRPKKRTRKALPEGDPVTEKKPRKRKSTTEDGTEPRPVQRRKARSVTPEDSESQVVDLQKLKMSDLTRDLHIGRKFSRHDELRERERRKRSKSAIGDQDGGVEGSATPESSQAAKKDSPADPSGPTPASGPQFRIVDGQIVVDQSSLVMDRHARDKAAQGDMEIVEENDFTRLITSNSFMSTSKLKGPNIWTDEETELFYRALRMFGTDFEMISKMFPAKQRRQVKLKFNREERHSPQRIHAALVGEKTIKIDLEEYKAHTGTEFEPVETIEAEQRKMEEEFEAERKRVADEQAEIMRQKREELFADDDEDGKKKKRKKKQTIVYGLNGEPITTEE